MFGPLDRPPCRAICATTLSREGVASLDQVRPGPVACTRAVVAGVDAESAEKALKCALRAWPLGPVTGQVTGLGPCLRFGSNELGVRTVIGCAALQGGFGETRFRRALSVATLRLSCRIALHSRELQLNSGTKDTDVGSRTMDFWFPVSSRVGYAPWSEEHPARGSAEGRIPADDGTGPKQASPGHNRRAWVGGLSIRNWGSQE